MFGKHLPSTVHRDNEDWDELNPREKHVTSALSVRVEHLSGDIYGKDPKAFINALIHASSS